MELKRLPDTEFEIMKVIWGAAAPVKTSVVMEALGKKRRWKPASLASFMKRLEEKGFLRSEKNGKERDYYPVVSHDEYRSFEAGVCLKQYHDNSPLKLFQSLYDDKQLTQQDLEQLIEFARQHRED